MKKLIIFVCLITISIGSTYSQKWNNYIQFGVGTGYLVNADINDTPLLQFEYGNSYKKWFDVTAAFEYAYSVTFDVYMSLILKAKVDIVRAFVDSRHSFKLGIGTGIGIGSEYLQEWYDVSENNEDYSGLYSISSVMASYEYRITNDAWLGVFFNNYVGRSEYFGLHYLGLSIRRNL